MYIYIYISSYLFIFNIYMYNNLIYIIRFTVIYSITIIHIK